ncbi:MAG: hypothetical protein OEV52_01345 [Dehalococcoidia bacterium]|nr:hypothetical protein [Dehalococcoidia bacterium]
MKNRILSILLAVALVLGIGLIGCGGEEVPEYSLTISSTEGGSVTSPGQPGPYTYDEGKVVNLVAEAEEGYRFVGWTGDVDTIADVEDASTTITMNGDYTITAQFAANQCNLTISSTEGGSVTTPREATSTYDYGTVVDLVATPDSGCQFLNWTGDVGAIVDVNAASTTITMNGDYSITASFAKEIWDWYDLDGIRDNLGGSYILMNNLDSTSAGYGELAGPTANGGRGWEPIEAFESHATAGGFAGAFEGRRYEIRDLFISRPTEEYVGLFGIVDRGGLIRNLGVLLNAEMMGGHYVGSLVGENHGVVHSSYSSGRVAGDDHVGGLVGMNRGIVSNSYFTGSLTGGMPIGGLVAETSGAVSNSYYNRDEVLINGDSMITIGALFDDDFEQWLANDKFLDVNERLAREAGYYVINDVNDLKELLAFGQDGSLKFRLRNDLDLGTEPDFYIPYLAGEFDGNGHRIRNLRVNSDSVAQVGLFGYLASGGKVSEVGAENVDITGYSAVGGLVGSNGWNSAVCNSYCSGVVTGRWESVGGLVGDSWGTVSNSYFSGSVTGDLSVGGLVGLNDGNVANSHYSYDEVSINGQNIITIGALFDEDFEHWLASDKYLDLNGRLCQEDGYYLINDVGDFKQLLAFGQDGSSKFRLKNDLDLSGDPNFYIPYLAGEFDGNGHRICNLSFNSGFVSSVGLFGYLGSGGKISEVGVENVNVTAGRQVGGLVGVSAGTISNSYSSGRLTGRFNVGGLAGWKLHGAISKSYSTCSVSGEWLVGGLVGELGWSSVSKCYSTGSVNGHKYVGGLVGLSVEGIVSNSFWDTEISGQATSDGGTGKTTAEIKSIATFSSAGWNIIAVANPSIRNTAYIWNIVDGHTYPFLSWQPVS